MTSRNNPDQRLTRLQQLRQQHEQLCTAIEPASAGLDRGRNRFAARYGLHSGVEMLPRLALGFVAGFLVLILISDGTPFPPWLLPFLLLITPVATASSYWLQSRRQPSMVYETAAVLDQNLKSKDRLSTALEFTATDFAGGQGRSAALARAAIEDGIAWLPNVDTSRTELEEPELAWHWRPIIIALLITLLPSFFSVPSTLRKGNEEHEIAIRLLEDSPAATEFSRDTTSHAATTARIATSQTAEARVAEAPPEHASTDDEHESSTRQKNEPGQRGGSGTSGNSPQKHAPDQQESSGRPQDSEAGSPSSGGAGAGGEGQAKSKPEQESGVQRNRRQPKKPRRPKKQGETKGDDEQSSSNPSGSSQGGGKMSAVGNQRSGRDRGSEREDDPESDDEEVEDEEEESEARGGVMPMTRDRKQPPSRELGISGDGPPGDGRGGPTPPKKSRGTASLVLGIKLPDQVRGQPNPGTAKTSIEQIPPKPSDRDARATTPAQSGPSSKNPQTRSQHDRVLAPALRRYHDLLRQQSRRSK